MLGVETNFASSENRGGKRRLSLSLSLSLVSLNENAALRLVERRARAIILFIRALIFARAFFARRQRNDDVTIYRPENTGRLSRCTTVAGTTFRVTFDVANPL